jgi:hypothetical protein
MDRCPNCRARYESGDSCRRCGMDLGSLLALERAVDGQIVRALGQFARGEVPAGRQNLAKARKLHPTPMTHHLLGFAQDLADTLEPAEAATNTIHVTNNQDMVADGDLEHPPATVGTRRGVTRADLVKWIAWLLMALAALIAFLSRWL